MKSSITGVVKVKGGAMPTLELKHYALESKSISRSPPPAQPAVGDDIRCLHDYLQIKCFQIFPQIWKIMQSRVSANVCQ